MTTELNYSKDYHYVGKIEGLFIATEQDIDKFLVNRTIDFGGVFQLYRNLKSSNTRVRN